jgi:hypothetical protein
MLMRQKAWAEGMRALVLYTATVQDQVELNHAAGVDDTLPARLNDLLLPIVKGYGSEKSYELLATSLQIFGGSGFTQDYPIEQYIRDAKIDTLYEGTTTIQGMDLFFRKIIRDQGEAINHVRNEMIAFAKDMGGPLDTERELLSHAISDVTHIVLASNNQLGKSLEDPRNIYKVGLNTTRILMALGDLAVGWLLLRQAEVALGKLDGASDRDKHFYAGKVAAARWFAANVFPELASKRAIAESLDASIMDLDEAAF